MEKKLKSSLLVLGAVSLVSLTSCNGWTIYDLFGKGSSQWTGTLTEAERAGTSEVLYQDISRQQYIDYGVYTPSMPTVGNVNLLVIPIEFADYPFTDEQLTDLYNAFNDDDPSYYESVSSFIFESSYGNLNLTFDIAEVYSSNLISTSYIPYSASSSAATSYVASLCRTALADAAEDIDDPSRYDYDGDGYYDAVYFVYSAPNYQTASVSMNQSAYWAYCTYYTGSQQIGDLKLSNYFWASIDFIYEKWLVEGTERPSGYVDAHTFIHETGHLMGLDDYYNYDVGEDLDCDNGSPMAGLTMMDYNLGDYDAWSKYAIGWVDPYVVDDRYSFPISIEFNPTETTGDCVVIPVNGSFNGTPFDEYIVLELLTGSGVAETDANEKYISSYAYYYTGPGVRMTHVDSRIIEMIPTDSTYTYFYYSYVDPDIDDLESASANRFYYVPASNTPTSSVVDAEYKLISTISSLSEYVLDKTNYWGSNAILFHSGDTFTAEDYAENFLTDDDGNVIMNNGGEFPFSIAFDEVTKNRAVITIDLL